MIRFKQDCCGKQSTHYYYGIRFGRLRLEVWPNQASFFVGRRAISLHKLVVRLDQAPQVVALGGNGLFKSSNYKEY